MAQYYTLEEAARVLQTTPEEVRKMADDKKLRTFRDKGTLRFRAQEIEELARQMGIGSDPDLQLGEVPQPKKGSSPVPKRPSRIDKPGKPEPPAKSKRPSKLQKPGDDEEKKTFDFSLSLDEEEEQVQLGVLPPAAPGSSKSGKQSKPPGPPSPVPKPGSDSDVRLVPDSGGAADFDLPLGDEPAPKPSPKPTPKPKKKSKLAGQDSGVRIVPLDPSDSDIKMVLDQGDDVVALGGAKPMSASDSDIRLEQHASKKKKDASDPSMVTEEIDLDAEISSLGSTTPQPRPRPSAPQLPTSSPFELSEEDLGMDDPPAGQQTMQRPMTDSSGDFELAPGGEDMSPLDLGSDEMPAMQMEDEEVSLGELSSPSSGGSGINLRDPSDSGISLEQEGSDEIELDNLSLDAGSTPAPQKKQAKHEPDADSSEFELSLDDSDESSETVGAESSEFELSLDDSGSSELELDLEPAAKGGDDSDSEFELTLDDSGGSAPLDEEGEDKDIFETDFEVPALEEESGSEVAALDEDTDVESSDFDLAIDEMDVGAEDESGSQVVALEDEELDLDAGAAPKKRKTRMLAADEDEDASEFAGIGPVDGEEEDEHAAVAPGRGKVVYLEKPDAPWGPVPAMLMLPSMIVLILVGLMGFELIQGMVSYQKTGKFSGLLIRPLTEALTGETLPGGKK